MSDLKAEQIISGIKEMLIKADAITPRNAHALDEVLNTLVLQNIIDYGKQANGVTTEEKQCNLPVVTTRFYYFDCWDKTGELQTKPIKATCEEHATLLFEKEFGETHRYDPPYN